MEKKIARTNHFIRKEVGRIIHQSLDLPQGVLATVTRVETSSDLLKARVYVSCIPEASEALKILEKNVYSIQQKLNKKMKVKIVPKIEFAEEKKTKEAARIEELLEKARKEK